MMYKVEVREKSGSATNLVEATSIEEVVSKVREVSECKTMIILETFKIGDVLVVNDKPVAIIG